MRSLSGHPVLQLRPARIEGKSCDDTGIATVRETAADDTPLVGEIRAPVADVDRHRLPAVRDAGSPGELFERIRVIDELVAQSGVYGEIVRQGDSHAAGNPGRRISALIEVRRKEYAAAEGDQSL